MIVAAILVVGALGQAGCRDRAADVGGVWDGTWKSADGQSEGSFRVDVTQRGVTLEGPIQLSLEWLPRARIAGTVAGNRVTWGVLQGGVAVLSFEGTITGDTGAGAYAVGSTAGGTWTARRIAR